MQRPKLNDLIALALTAAQEINMVRESGFEAIKKSDGSPVTIADQRAEAVIEAGLKKLVPDAPMIGEEAVAEGRIPDPGARFFCVDPLDGTRDFVAGGDEFTVNIGWIEDHAPTCGVVLSPASGEIYAGEPGRALRGVFDMKTGVLREALAPIHTSATKPESGWRVYASRYSGANSRTAKFSAALGRHEVMRGSSSIKFCRLAEGAAELYPRFGDVNEWDAAAGHAVLSAAGGGVMLLDGAPLRYGNTARKFLINGFIAFANAAAASAARDILTQNPELR